MQSITSLPRAIARSPAMSGVSLALVGVALWVVLEKLAGAMGAGSDTPVIDGVAVMLLFVQTGYFLSVIPLIRKAGAECVDELGSSLALSDPHCAELAGRFSRSTLPLVGVAAALGALITIVMQETQFSRFSGWLSLPGLSLGEMWLVFSAWATWTLALSSIALLISSLSTIHQLGRDYVAVDLMRIEQLAVFSRYGLRLTRFVVTLMALWAVSLVIATSFASITWAENSNYAVPVVIALYVFLAVTAFLFPQLGIRQRIRSEKGRVSHQLTAMLPAAEHTLIEADSNPERLAALLSSRNQIQALPEWPAGQHTHVRLLVYLVVPLLSWSAAALVEEVISRLIS